MPTLRELRKRKRMSAQELAELAGISRNTIVLIEKGNYWPMDRTIRALAKALKVKPEEIQF